MRIRPERFVRATARTFVALATASLVALIALAVAVAPTAPVEALAVAGQSWIPGEIPPEPGDRALHDASPAEGGLDDGDDAVALHAGVARQVTARRTGVAAARRRDIRLITGSAPRGPPTN
ncbi:hypothetical protein [Agromyces silvae]|uniref:hypothetical protein n=1 Tax=Agromyces silvae TaxID=3388266 RepID=UPI00280BDECE|nr:hypothetical protein [Agromyces protaetiae]